MANLIEQIDFLLEASEHNPFKRKSSLGPGPKGSGNNKTGEWDCSCKDYKCSCTSNETGKTITFRANKSSKKAYNKAYKQHTPYKRSRPAIRKERADKKKSKG